MNSTPSIIPTTTVPRLAENITIAKNQSFANVTRGEGNDNNYLIILIPVVAVFGLISAVLTIAWLLKRNRMEKLRQHLMPMYSLDVSDSGQEWEQDLLSQEVRHGTDCATLALIHPGVQGDLDPSCGDDAGNICHGQCVGGQCVPIS